jgi:molybdopterin synthase catalytic subunit
MIAALVSVLRARLIPMSDDAVDIGLFRQRLDVAAAVARVTCPAGGGIAVFLGTTRAQHPPQTDSCDDEGALIALDYQAYEEMAIREIQKYVAEAQQRWPIERVAVWHRLGEVRVGEASVVIAVSCPHRQEAFAACQFIIDSLKKSAPIWKREVYRHASRWQGESPAEARAR